MISAIKGIILLFVACFILSCSQSSQDISGVYVVDKWDKSIIFSVGQVGYEVIKNSEGYSFTLIGVKEGRIIGKKETKQARLENGFFTFEMLPPIDSKLGFILPGVILKLKSDGNGLQGFVERGKNESDPIHFKKLY